MCKHEVSKVDVIVGWVEVGVSMEPKTGSDGAQEDGGGRIARQKTQLYQVPLNTGTLLIPTKAGA